MMKKYNKRNKYMRIIKPFINKGLIKFIIGQRRVGKSYLMYQIMDEIKKINKRANIIYINKELYEYDEIRDYKDLMKYIKDKSNNKKKNYVFIDEIQDINKFEKALRSLQDNSKYDLYCTGSNANILSGELATYLSGRYINIPVYSLTYLEFLDFHKLESNEESLFKYIKYGGLPYLKNLVLDDEIVNNYLRSVFDTIILKDIVSRYNIRNVEFLRRLVLYLADNVGSLISANKIDDFLKSQKTDLSPNTILNYLEYLVSAFFIYRTSREDIIGKKIFEVNEKYYFNDLGLRHAILGYKQIDINKILENLVFNHLQTLGYQVRVGKLKDKEIDFVAEKKDSKIYVQVVYLLSSKKVKEREFGNLLEIKDNNPKYVVSMDMGAGGQEKGIKHIKIIDFLLMTNFI